MAEEESGAGMGFILWFDGKLIGSRIGQNGLGDVNLMGIEGPPTVKQAKEMLSHDSETAQKVGEEISEDENVSLHAAWL